jgi:hypothetical protein
MFWLLRFQDVEINSFCIPFNSWHYKVVFSLQHIKKFFRISSKLPLLFKLLHLLSHRLGFAGFEFNQPPWENMRANLHVSHSSITQGGHKHARSRAINNVGSIVDIE